MKYTLTEEQKELIDRWKEMSREEAQELFKTKEFQELPEQEKKGMIRMSTRTEETICYPLPGTDGRIRMFGTRKIDPQMDKQNPKS